MHAHGGARCSSGARLRQRQRRTAGFKWHTARHRRGACSSVTGYTHPEPHPNDYRGIRSTRCNCVARAVNSVAEASQLPVAAEIAAASVHSLRSSSAPAILRDDSERNGTFHTGAAHHSLVAMTHSTESAIRVEGCLIRPIVKCQLAVRLWRSQFQVAKACFVYLFLTVCVLFVSFRSVLFFVRFSRCFFCRVLMFAFRFCLFVFFFFVFFVSWGPRQWHTGVGSCRQGLMSLIDTKHMEDSCASKAADECPGTFVPDSE